MNQYKSLAANTLLISVGTFGSKLLVFLMVRFYTDYLTPADYGTADLLTQTANLLIPLCSLGIVDGVFRFSIDQTDRRSDIFTVGCRTIGAGCVLIGILIPLLQQISAISSYAWLVAAFVSAACIHSLCAQFIRAQGKTTLFAIQGLVNTALVIGLNITFLAFLHLGVTGYVLSVVLADLLTTCMLVFKERLWRNLVHRLQRGIFHEMLHYSLPLIPATVFWWITSVSDRYMVTAFLGAEETGLYSMAYKIPTILTLVSMVFMEAWHLSAVREASGSRNGHLRFYSTVWSAFQSAMLLCGSVIIGFSQTAIRLLAADSYFSAWICIPILSMATVYASFCSFFGSVYVVTKKSSLSLLTSMIGAAVNVGLNLWLIPSRLGVQGAAIATFASYAVVLIIRIINARTLIPFEIHGAKLAAGTVILAVQTVFIVLQLPAWRLVQGVGIALIFALSVKMLLSVLSKVRTNDT